MQVGRQAHSVSSSGVKGGAMKDHRGGEKLYHLAVVVQHKCPC